MTTTIALRSLKSLLESFAKHEIEKNSDQPLLEQIENLASNVFIGLLEDCGWFSDPRPSFDHCGTAKDYIQEMLNICHRLSGQFLHYLKGLSLRSEPVPYDGPLCGYFDFLFPLLCELKNLPFMPNAPIFLLIDDADNLNLDQTKVLNSWVASRTSSKVSIKASTQFQYKTYRTAIGHSIDTPHDYSEVNISTVYTTSWKTKYPERVGEMISRRLNFFGIDRSPQEFFPDDLAQENAIRKIKDEYREKSKSESRGYRPGDDAYRYARPDYMKGLVGPSKSTLVGSSKSSSSYSYSGYKQLVHISSGVVRNFLEAAAQMYSEVRAKSGSKPIKSIPPGIQSSVVRDLANDFLFSEFDKNEHDQYLDACDKVKSKQLFNLIQALGGTFREILLSDRSERRVFSMAFSDEPTEEIKKVLKHGVHLGYFHVSSIGKKDGTGRTRLYILNRKLAPFFNLDPTGFAGYLFVTSDPILAAMQNPDALLRRVKGGDIDNIFESRQLRLFE